MCVKSGENRILKEMSSMSRSFSKGNGWILFLMIISGIVIGGFLGELIGQYVPILKYGIDFGVSTHTWDLKILELTQKKYPSITFIGADSRF